ncbi:MAG: hypothetical protein ACOX9C_02145 [Kiritimatiellia bacterium]|jgi:hypothetical protein
MRIRRLRAAFPSSDMMPSAPHNPSGFRLGLAAALLLGVLADVASGQEEATAFELSPRALEIAEKLRDLAPTTSADGSVRVSGGSLGTLDRMDLLRFAADVRTRLEQLTGSKFQGRNFSIALLVPKADEERPATISLQTIPPPAQESGLVVHPAIRLTIVNLAKLDPRDLTCSICDGLLRMKVVEAAGGGVQLQPPPRWFAEGLGHYLEASRRQDDAEDVLKLWQQAALPPLNRLAASHSPYAAADRRVSAQLAAYWLDFPERAARLDQLCRALASGEPWSARLFAETSSGLANLGEADKDFDRWLLTRRHSVLTPGVTRREFVVRAWRSLLLHPGEDGVPAEIPAGSPPSLLLRHGAEPWVRESARVKARKLMIMAAGRGAAFQEAATAWAAIFDAIARGERAAKLEADLLHAEKLLRDSATPAVSQEGD